MLHHLTNKGDLKCTLEINAKGDYPLIKIVDIRNNGIYLTGGSSSIRNLDILISKETGVPVILVEKPLECVALGAGEAFNLFKNMSFERSVYDSLNE